MGTDLDVCPHCGGEIGFGQRQHHLDEACVPEERPRPGLAGRMPPIGFGHRFRAATEEDMARVREYMRRRQR